MTNPDRTSQGSEQPQPKSRNRLLAWATIFALVGTGLCPPWVTVWGSSAGYHWLFIPPSDPLHLDLTRLLVEWFLVLVVAGGFLWAAPPKGSLRRAWKWIWICGGGGTEFSPAEAFVAIIAPLAILCALTTLFIIGATAKQGARTEASKALNFDFGSYHASSHLPDPTTPGMTAGLSPSPPLAARTDKPLPAELLNEKGPAPATPAADSSPPATAPLIQPSASPGTAETICVTYRGYLNGKPVTFPPGIDLDGETTMDWARMVGYMPSFPVTVWPELIGYQSVSCPIGQIQLSIEVRVTDGTRIVVGPKGNLERDHNPQIVHSIYGKYGSHTAHWQSSAIGTELAKDKPPAGIRLYRGMVSVLKLIDPNYSQIATGIVLDEKRPELKGK